MFGVNREPSQYGWACKSLHPVEYTVNSSRQFSGQRSPEIQSVSESEGPVYRANGRRVVI